MLHAQQPLPLSYWALSFVAMLTVKVTVRAYMFGVHPRYIRHKNYELYKNASLGENFMFMLMLLLLATTLE